MALNNDDLFLVNQGGVSKKITYENLKTNLNADEALWELDGTTIKPKEDTHNVGIGASNDKDGLSLGRNINFAFNSEDSGDTARLRWRYHEGEVAWIERDNTDGSLAFGVQGDERVRINSFGNVLIGESNTASPNIELHGDGKSFFKEVHISDDTVNAVFSAGNLSTPEAIRMWPTGSCYLANGKTRLESDGNVNIGGTVPDPNIALNVDGDATFKGRIRSNPVAGLGNYAEIHYEDGIQMITANVTKAHIRNDGSATFDGSVIVDGNRPVIAAGDNLIIDEGTPQEVNVQERVLNLVSRLDAIEANEIIDDAVDTSLLSLMASASARLDSIEARLAALEGGN